MGIKVRPTMEERLLKRVPHIFPRVLELPVHRNTQVVVLEADEGFVFNAPCDAAPVQPAVQLVEIVPGAVKVKVGEGLKFYDCWRFRLPLAASVEDTQVDYRGGSLIVTVPKQRQQQQLEQQQHRHRVALV